MPVPTMLLLVRCRVPHRTEVRDGLTLGLLQESHAYVEVERHRHDHHHKEVDEVVMVALADAPAEEDSEREATGA
jgi:hypothetical protein